MILIIVSFVNIIHQVKKFILILILLGLLITTEFFISSNASSVSTGIIKWFFLFSLFIYPLTMKDFFLRLPIPAVVLLLPCASCGPRGPENFFSAFVLYLPNACKAVVVIQSLSHVWLFATPWTAAHQASLSFTISRSLLKLVSIESVMPSNHLILCHSPLAFYLS